MRDEDCQRSVAHAAAALTDGRLVIVIDDADRENEGDLVAAAATITADQMAFMVRHTTGIICAPMTSDRADRLGLAQMVENNSDVHRTAFTVTVDHVSTGSGVSATDRTATVRALSDEASQAADFRRPGHVFPLRAQTGGVLARPGHTEAAIDLLRISGKGDVGVIGEIVAEDGSMRQGRDLLAFAAEHDLPVVRIADLIHYRIANGHLIERMGTAAMPTEFGDFRAIAYWSAADRTEHLALVMGEPAAAGGTEAGALVRVHSECLTGDILGSRRCDRGAQLERALQAIAKEGSGVLVYLRGHEGRGIGLAHKIRAYALQDRGLDTIDANLVQDLPADSRSYAVGAHILADLGVRRIRLISNNPAKYGALQSDSLEIVGQVNLPTTLGRHNVRYLRAKRDRMGHRFVTEAGVEWTAATAPVGASSSAPQFGNRATT